MHTDAYLYMSSVLMLPSYSHHGSLSCHPFPRWSDEQVSEGMGLLQKRRFHSVLRPASQHGGEVDTIQPVIQKNKMLNWFLYANITIELLNSGFISKPSTFSSLANQVHLLDKQ